MGDAERIMEMPRTKSYHEPRGPYYIYYTALRLRLRITLYSLYRTETKLKTLLCSEPLCLQKAITQALMVILSSNFFYFVPE